MWKKTLILTVVCVFALALVSIAEDRVPVKSDLQKRFDRNRDGFIDREEQKPLHKFLQTKAIIEKLRSMAREAEEKSKRFRAEAEELERTLKREFERRKTAGSMEKMHARLAELKEAIKHAKREGWHDRAAELHERAMRMTDKIKAHQREAGEKKFHEVEKRIVQLQEWTRQAKERGQMDKAERLWAEAKELKGTLKRELEHREMAGRMEKMHAGLAELKEAAEHAKREGQHDKADTLRKKAEHLAEKIAMTVQQGKARIKKDIEKLHAMAGKAKEAGYHEKAKAFLQKAKNLQRQLRDVAKGAIFAFAPSMSGEREVRPTVTRHSAASQPAAERSGGERNSLKVMTLNVAHGRGDGPNQVLQKGKNIRANLDEIAAVLRRVGPDMAAIQEADGPSVWSGKVDQVSYLAEKAGFAYSVHGEHVKGMKISYGTGLLSMLALRGPLAITFEASPPTFSKGFVVATVDWPGDPNIKVDVVSVHLDFLRKSVREWQVEDMIDRLSSRGRPLIVMGDFNSEWKSKESAVRAVAEGLNLKAYQPASPEMDTFPLLRRRMDWILISDELEFVRYEVLPDVISDHYGVVCEVRMKGE